MIEEIKEHVIAIVEVYRKHQNFGDEALDGDNVDDLMKIVTDIANNYQGNK